MVSRALIEEVKDFLKILGHDYFGHTLIADEETGNKILNHYLPVAQAQPESVKRQCLDIMRQSCNENEDHGHLPDWKGTLMNILYFCVLPTTSYHEIEETQKLPYDSFRNPAISSIIRFSRWYHTDTGFYIRFKPYAEQIGTLLWDDMEVLNRYNP
jgi:hypothetical protein